MKIYYPVVLDENFTFEPENFDEFFSISDGEYDKFLEDGVNFRHFIEQGNFFGDFTWCDNATVLLLRTELSSNEFFSSCNFLPIQRNHEYKVICPPILECLNFKKSKITYLPNTDTIISINKYIFKKNSIPEEVLFFKIKGLKASPVFCTEKLVKFYEENNLTGIQFKEVQS